MKILVAHNVPRARNGGMSRIMGEIHDRIPAQVDYFTAEDIPERYRNRWLRFVYPYLVYRRAREGNYDIVNVHEPSGALVALLKGHAKVVVTSHGVEQRGWEVSIEDAKLGRGGPGARTRIVYPLTSLWQSRLALTHASHVFCLNFQDRDYLVDRFGIAPERIARIYPAASPVYATHRDYTRFRRVLFAGTWLTRKGNLDALAAMRDHPDLEFATLGAGVPAEQIPNAIAMETKSDADAARALSTADVFLLPSVFEGTPLTLMEAMRSGLPAITTDTCGMRDVIQHDVNGLLVPMRSPGAISAALTRLKRDPELRARLGRAAAAAPYSWEQSAAAVWQVYVSLLGTGSSPGRD
jgi:glycosyltransferase involved in cell wall biosynthesis